MTPFQCNSVPATNSSISSHPPLRRYLPASQVLKHHRGVRSLQGGHLCRCRLGHYSCRIRSPELWRWSSDQCHWHPELQGSCLPRRSHLRCYLCSCRKLRSFQPCPQHNTYSIYSTSAKSSLRSDPSRLLASMPSQRSSRLSASPCS